MTTTTHPTKESVRDWLRRTIDSKAPPESMERIREVLGWKLIHERKSRTKSQ